MITQRTGLDVALETGRTGQFDLLADGELISTRAGNWFTRKLGAGYPDFEAVVALVQQRQGP